MRKTRSKAKVTSKDKNSLTEGGRLYEKLTEVTFRKGSKIYRLDMGQELLIYSEDPHVQIEKISAVMGYFGTIVALLEKEYKDKLALKKKIEGLIDKKIRSAGVTGEGRVIGAAKRHPKMLDAELEVNEALANYKSARNIFYSLKEKAAVLHTRSADIRVVPSDSLMVHVKNDIIDLD